MKGIRGCVPTEKNPVWKEVLDWVLHIGIAVVIGLLIVTFVAQRTIVEGSSMEPTLQDKDQLIIEKISPRLGGLHRGDIVTVDVPEFLEEGKEYVIKRIIALEGDSVEIKDGKVYVNGSEEKAEYTTGEPTEPSNSEYSKLTVPKGCIYFLGDNRMNSRDSRVMGPVSIKKVKGKAIFRYYPFSKIGTL